MDVKSESEIKDELEESTIVINNDKIFEQDSELEEIQRKNFNSNISTKDEKEIKDEPLDFQEYIENGDDFKQISGLGESEVLSHADGGGFDNIIAIDAIAGDSNLLSRQLMVANLLKSDSKLDDKIPDTKTITIDRKHSARIVDDVDQPIGLGPWTCQRCGLTLNSLAQFKKHEKKHVEDKLYPCAKCSEAFNIKKNYDLHMMIHNSIDLNCPECGKIFKRLASFKSHLVGHQEEEILFCNLCGDEFFSLNQLEDHKLMSHMGDPLSIEDQVIKTEPTDNPPTAFDCIECSGSFNSALELKNHSLLHKKVKKKLTARPRKKVMNRSEFEEKCTVCGKGFSKPSQLVRHMRTHTGERPFKCTYPGCDRAFTQKGAMLLHLDIHYDKKSHKCDLCGKSFVQKTNLRSHVKRLHPSSKSDEQRYYCAECPCVFKRYNGLNAHVSKVHILETILNTNKTSNEIQNIEKQVNDIESKTDLNMSTSEKDAVVVGASEGDNGLDNKTLSVVDGDILQQAPKNSDLAQSKDVNGVKVEKLDDSDDERNIQKVHTMTIYVRVKEGNVRRYCVQVRPEGDTRWYMCDFKDCKTEFKKPSDLVRHMRVYKHEKNYKTLIRDGEEVEDDILEVKITTRKKPPKNKIFHCKYCKFWFKTKNELKSHLKSQHSQSRFKCSHCNYECYFKSKLKYHLLKHSNSKLYKCSKCLYGCNHKGSLKLHMLTHENIKLFKCSECDYECNQKGSLKLHILTHANFKLFKCPECEYECNQKRRLKLHMLTHTNLKLFKCSECEYKCNQKANLKLHMLKHSNIKLFKCSDCNYESNWKKCLKLHRLSHANIKLFKCSECDFECNLKQSLTRHLLTHANCTTSRETPGKGIHTGVEYDSN